MSDRSFCARFGPEVARAGVDTFPRALFDLAEAEGFSPVERLTAAALLAAKGRPNRQLSARALAERAGISRRKAIEGLRSLEARGLIRVVRRREPGRGDLPNEYDLSPLLERLEALARERQAPRPPKAGGFADRFGPVLAADGILAVPGAVGGLKLDRSQRLVLLALLAAKWDDRNPELSTAELRRRTGLPRRSLFRALQKLRSAGLLVTARRGRRTEFDVGPLLKALSVPQVDTGGVHLRHSGGEPVPQVDTPVCTNGTLKVPQVDTPVCTNGTLPARRVPLVDTNTEALEKKKNIQKHKEDRSGPAAFSKGQAPPSEDLRVLFGVLGVKALPAGEFKAYRQLMERFGAEQVAAAAGELVGRGVRPAPAAVAAVLAGGAAGGAAGVEDLQAVWARMQAALKSRLSANNYRAYVEPLRPVGLAGGRLTLSGSGFVIDWVRTRFLTLFKRAAQEAGLDGVQFAADRPGPAPSGRPAAV
jgi:DNA-binding MarR family transcriptional regulator